jgi:transcriptional regulator with XRE-family HTH domain
MSKRDQVLAAFGRNVRKQREANGLTQEALAERADLDRTYISDIERGTRNPGVKNVARLAKALGISPARLMEGVSAWTCSVRGRDRRRIPLPAVELLTRRYARSGWPVALELSGNPSRS